jgi:hypothetical protein|tara:strand:+ start:1586 stop:1954 length:369 start_codon:yes stop_codon:yes gene_type:complete
MNDSLNLIWDNDLSQFYVLDGDMNMVNCDIDLSRCNNLHTLLSNIMRKDLIQQDCIKDQVEDIYMCIVEKIYESNSNDEHLIHKFKTSLNERTETKLSIAFNKFIANKLETLSNKKVIISYG